MVGRKRKLTAAQEAELVLWWLSVRSIRAKARDLGIGVSTIYEILGRHGARNSARTWADRKVRDYMRQMNKGARNERTAEV